jgi:O-antigen/teichoic acid export membrane protein
MFNFGKFIFLGATVSFLRMNLDNILVGKLLGVTALGLYAVAFNISNFGADYFAGKIQRVTFPAYSKLHGNLEHLQKAFLKILKHTSLIALPLGIGLFLLAEDFIRLFYGEKWIGATSILKILSCLGTFNTLLTALVGIFLGIGKPRLYFLINLLQVIIFVMFISPAAKIFGLNGIGVVVGLSSFIAFFLASVLVIRLLSLNFNQLYPNLKPALLSTLMMVIGIVISKKILSYNNSILLPYYTFPLLIIIGIIFYSVTLSKIEKPIFKEIKEILVS